MPIRFRCAFCNQLMGIARRKAGMVVNCPNCSGQVVVPGDDVPDAPDGSADAPADTQAPMFERSDFEELFKSGGMKQAPVAAPPATDFSSLPSVPARRPDAKAVAPLPPPPPAPAPALPRPFTPALTAPPPGYVISPSMATLLSVAMVVALALAFAAGLLVGRFYLQADPDDPAAKNQPARQI